MTPEAIFEAPVAHETGYANPEDYSTPEFEWEAHEAHYANPYANPEWEAHYANPEDYSTPEMEGEAHYANPEWEAHEAHYANPYANPEWEAHYANPEDYSTPEMEGEAHYANPEWEAHYANPYANPEDYSTPEFEWEAHEAHYANPYANPEWEAHYANPYANPEDYSTPEAEWEDEGEYFFKRAFRAIKRVGKFVAPLAKRIAPFAVKALVGMVPGVGALAAPLAGQLTSQLLREGVMEASAAEAEFFGTNEAEAEVGHTETAHEAALTEMLAAEAAEAESEAEAEAVLAAALPLTITIMGGRRALRPVMPALAQANGCLVNVLRRQGGRPGRQLLRTVPTIQRRTVATLRAASRAGQPITGPLAVRAMAAATQSVLNNPRAVDRALTRNAMLRRRVAPPSPRRAAVFAPRRVAPPHPRRAAGYRPMRAVRG